MADIVRSDPFANLRREVQRMFDRRWSPWLLEGDEIDFPLDVSEAENKIVVRASLPGYKKEEIEVHVHEGMLTISAQHEEEEETKGERYYRRERRMGAVSRRVSLPGVTAASAVDAELKDGVLTLNISVPEQTRPKQIPIRAA